MTIGMSHAFPALRGVFRRSQIHGGVGGAFGPSLRRLVYASS